MTKVARPFIHSLADLPLADLRKAISLDRTSSPAANRLQLSAGRQELVRGECNARFHGFLIYLSLRLYPATLATSCPAPSFDILVRVLHASGLANDTPSCVRQKSESTLKLPQHSPAHSPALQELCWHLAISQYFGLAQSSLSAKQNESLAVAQTPADAPLQHRSGGTPHSSSSDVTPDTMPASSRQLPATPAHPRRTHPPTPSACMP